MKKEEQSRETIGKILNSSSNLFLTKGYENTTIQDIINESKITKGAVYHHFKSKEEILERILDNYKANSQAFMNELMATTKGKNAREKLEKIMLAYIEKIENEHTNKHSDYLITQAAASNAQFIVAELKINIVENAEIILKLFFEGTKDGSIQTDYPLETAEIFMMLLNIWTNPTLFQRSKEQTSARLKALQYTMKQLGADFLTDELIEKIIQAYSSTGVFQESK
jgi:TetR/AcrR family transcriptional repressor of nem operon